MSMLLQVAFFYVTFGGMVTLTLAQTGLCPAQNGDFPNPSSELCATFFRCLQWLPSLLRCPPNQRFDFLFRFCRPEESVDCHSQLQVFAAPSLLSDIGGISPGLLSDIGGISPGLLSDIGGISPGLLSDIGGISPGLLSDIGGISPGLLSDIGGISPGLLSDIGGISPGLLSDIGGISPGLLSDIGGISPGLLSGTGGIGGLGAVSGLGAGLSERGLINLLSQLEGNENKEDTGNTQMATLLMMALINQMNSATQQETQAGPLPVSNLYPANSQSALNSFGGHGGQVINQHYQQPASAGLDNGLSLGTGRTFIFLPQYEPSTSQGHLPQGQGNMASAGPGTDAGDLGQQGVIQGAVQDRDAVKDPGIPPGHDNIQGQNRPGGQFSNSPPLVRRFPRRRGQGQRRRIQAGLADNVPPTTEGRGLNVNSTLGSRALSSTA